MFKDGERKEEWSTKNLLPMSGKLITEFDRRRNIRDMFSRKPSLSSQKSFAESEESELGSPSASVSMGPPPLSNGAETTHPKNDKAIAAYETVPVTSPLRSAGLKRVQKPEAPVSAAKRAKFGSQLASSNGSSKGQQSLKGFFQSKSLPINGSSSAAEVDTASELYLQSTPVVVPANDSSEIVNGPTTIQLDVSTQRKPALIADNSNLPSTFDEATSEASKQTWGKLFSKPISPNCEHNEPCKTMLTKKPGVNCGRSFWMCARPLGPSGNKERNTQWRCSTFIWASDWTGPGNG